MRLFLESEYFECKKNATFVPVAVKVTQAAYVNAITVIKTVMVTGVKISNIPKQYIHPM